MYFLMYVLLYIRQTFKGETFAVHQQGGKQYWRTFRSASMCMCTSTSYVYAWISYKMFWHVRTSLHTWLQNNFKRQFCLTTLLIPWFAAYLAIMAFCSGKIFIRLMFEIIHKLIWFISYILWQSLTAIPSCSQNTPQNTITYIYYNKYKNQTIIRIYTQM